MNASSTPPTHSISLHQQIYCFKISPFEFSTNLFCAVLQSKIVLGLLHFPVIYIAHTHTHKTQNVTLSIIKRYFLLIRRRTLMSITCNTKCWRSSTIVRVAMQSLSRQKRRCWHCRRQLLSVRLVLIFGCGFIGPTCRIRIPYNAWTDRTVTPATSTMCPGNPTRASTWLRLAMTIHAKYAASQKTIACKWCFDSNHRRCPYVGIRMIRTNC